MALKTTQFAALAASAILGWSTPSHAATIAWDAPTIISGDTDVAVTLRVLSETNAADAAEITLTVPIDRPYMAPEVNEAAVRMARERYERQKYGLFVHYVPGLTADPKGGHPGIDELVQRFDAARFAQDAKDFGVEYVIFTVMHLKACMLYPSAVNKRWRDDRRTPVQPGQSAEGKSYSEEDLIDRLATELKKHSIDLHLYVHPVDGHDFSMEDQDITGGFVGINPKATDADPLSWPATRNQVAMIIGSNWWAQSKTSMVRQSPENLARYIAHQASRSTHGGFAMSAGVFPGTLEEQGNGNLWEGDFHPTMIALARLLEPVAIAIKDTHSGRAYVTKEFEWVGQRTWGVSTESPDRRTVYLHVLRPPTARVLALGPTEDGTEFEIASAHLVKGGAYIFMR